MSKRRRRYCIKIITQHMLQNQRDVFYAVKLTLTRPFCTDPHIATLSPLHIFHHSFNACQPKLQKYVQRKQYCAHMS